MSRFPRTANFLWYYSPRDGVNGPCWSADTDGQCWPSMIQDHCFAWNEL
jgi:hypothetical protein